MINKNNFLEQDSFVVRYDFESLLVMVSGFTFFFGIIQISLIVTSKKLLQAFIPISPLYPIIIAGWIYTFDKRPKIIISRTGIWTKKSGKLEWDEIEYTALDFKQGYRSASYRFILKPKMSDESISLDISSFDKTREEINEAIENYSLGLGVVNLGLSNIT